MLYSALFCSLIFLYISSVLLRALLLRFLVFSLLPLKRLCSLFRSGTAILNPKFGDTTTHTHRPASIESLTFLPNSFFSQLCFMYTTVLRIRQQRDEIATYEPCPALFSPPSSRQGTGICGHCFTTPSLYWCVPLISARETQNRTQKV